MTISPKQKRSPKAAFNLSVSTYNTGG
ncbi:protein of unknown function [Shewanella benthica]|uniref:Uncharacterized protein n=1 Tax=Shewanella benthica TaxID=43661 RepID=A0A330LZR3_9GAMM|nr:protein of unknown function [Shewanella benthica]